MNVEEMVKRRINLRAWIIVSVIALSLALVPWMGTRTTAQTVVPRTGSAADRYVFSDLAEKVIPSVVTVYVKRDLRKEMSPQQLEQLKKLQKQFQDPLLRQFIPGMPAPDNGDDQGDEGSAGPGGPGGDQWITKGSGSGVIVSADGYVVTNWHVVGDKKNNPQIRVVLSDNTELSGKDVEVIESSKLADLALLKIHRPNLHPIPFGDSEKLRIGEWVAAIGSPLDLRLTVTQGIICAKHRTIDSGAGMGGMLQTDAVINPGSSGGALVNLDGQLIGVNRLITTPFQGREAWSGYGFAIPANDVKQFVDQVVKQGRVTYGYIGVGIANEFQDSDKLRQALGLSKDEKGALVMNVTAGGPAAEAGIQEGDLIVQTDGQTVADYNDLVSYVAHRPVGSVVKLVVLRPQENAKPKRVTLSLTIKERPSEEELLRSQNGEEPTPPAPKPQVREQNDLGVKVEPFSKGSRNGVKITAVEPGSVAQRNGLQDGDVITEINRMPVHNGADINKALALRKNQTHLIKGFRNNQPIMVPIDIKK